MISKACESLIKRSFQNDDALSLISQLQAFSANQSEDPEIKRVTGASYNPRVCRLIDIAIKNINANKSQVEETIKISIHSTVELLNSSSIESPILSIALLDAIRHLQNSPTLNKQLLLNGYETSLVFIPNEYKSFFESNLKRYKTKYL